MASADMFLNKRIGGTPSPAEIGVMLNQGVKRIVGEVPTNKVGIVTRFDRTNMRVDVKLKCSAPNNSPEYFDVPLINVGEVTSVPDIRTLQEALTDRSVKPTLGILMFMDEDAREAFDTHFQALPPTRMRHRGLGPVFLAGGLVLSSALTLPDDFEEGDHVEMDRRTGSHTIYRRNGDVIIRAAGEVYIGKVGQSLEDMKGAARQGDAGDGMGGSIAGGSSTVHIGD